MGSEWAGDGGNWVRIKGGWGGEDRQGWGEDWRGRGCGGEGVRIKGAEGWAVVWGGIREAEDGEAPE